MGISRGSADDGIGGTARTVPLSRHRSQDKYDLKIGRRGSKITWQQLKPTKAEQSEPFWQAAR